MAGAAVAHGHAYPGTEMAYGGQLKRMETRILELQDRYGGGGVEQAEHDKVPRAPTSPT